MRTLAFLPLLLIYAAGSPVLRGSSGQPRVLLANCYLKQPVTDDLLRIVRDAREKGRSCTAVLEELQKRVPILDRLAIKRDMFGIRHVTVDLERPWIIIARDGKEPRVATRSGRTTPAALIREDVLATLATISIDSQADSPEQLHALARWLACQPDTFFSRFSVLWHDRNDITVRDSGAPGLLIRASKETLFNQRLCAILHELSNGTGHYAAIDLRFGDEQIILVPKKCGGRGT
ncbi:MAG: hypothetical protein M1549_00895 [Candidatus Dependentiae bacterium]|nr:hypothetical protein [Candidatus Dependentiae bacterium]